MAEKINDSGETRSDNGVTSK